MRKALATLGLGLLLAGCTMPGAQTEETTEMTPVDTPVVEETTAAPEVTAPATTTEVAPAAATTPVEAPAAQ